MFGESDEQEAFFKHRITKSKIVATIGPTSESKECLKKLLDAGMEIARLNFSHGTHQWHANVIQRLRELTKETKKQCAVMVDLRGPHIRTGYFQEGIGRVKVQAGQPFTFHVNYVRGDKDRVTVSYWALPSLLKPGDKLMVDYGALSFTVSKIDDKAIHTVVDHDGTLGENKVVVVKGLDRPIHLQFMTYEDTVDIDFAVRHGADFVCANYVAKPADLEEIRRLPGVKESGVGIIAKIESREGIANADDIIAACDGVILPRSDIAVDMPVEQVAHIQKQLIYKANVEGKPVFIANQILNSMIQNPRPTRAECTDIANALLEGADGIVLTNTTAVGKYPLETVDIARRQFSEVEKALNYRKMYTDIRNHQLDFGKLSIADSIASSAVKTAWDLHSTLIIVLTKDATLARRLCKYRPHCPVMCVTSREDSARQTLLCKGSVPFIIDPIKDDQDYLQLFMAMAQKAKELGLVQSGEHVVAVTGQGPNTDETFQYQVVSCP